MAVFNPSTNRSLRGGTGNASPLRFFVYVLVSAALMFFDHQHHYLEQVRYLLQGVAFPAQLVVSSPAKAVAWAQENMQARDVLEVENQRLRDRERELELEVMRADALAKENGELRGLKEALPPVVDRWLVAEVVQVELDALRSRILINRGERNGLTVGQTVLDDAGVLGQTTHVGPWSAEVILITDPNHAIPVQVERSGEGRSKEPLYTIAVGAGDKLSLALPYLSVNADIKPGDRLITSGLGGVFPAGYPVGKVTEVNKDKSGINPLAQIRAVPFAHCCSSTTPNSFNGEREVMLVWFRDGNPASPVAAGDGDLKVGNEALQPQDKPPPKPKPKVQETAAADAAPAPAAASTQGTGAAAAPPPAAPKLPAAPAPKPVPKPVAPPAASLSSSTSSSQKSGR